MTVDEWNLKYPIGTKVRVTLYKTSDGNPGDTFDTETRSQCWALGHGTPVVLVKGKAGGYSVEPGWMEPLVPAQPDSKPSIVATWQLYRQRETAAFRKYGGILQTLCVLGFDQLERVICVGHGCAGKKRRMSIKSLLLRYEYVGEASQ